jgi:Translation initiation factor 6 (eIF-6)
VKYALLIYPRTTDEEWEALSEAEKGALYAEYGAVAQSPGVVGGHQLLGPRRQRPCGSRTARH